MDLCVGRWDDDKYRLFDGSKAELNPDKADQVGKEKNPEYIDGNKGQLWKHKDYNNSMKHTFNDPGNYYKTDDKMNRSKMVRGPWQDIGSVVYGQAAFDLGRHFIQRWNYTKKQSKHDDTFDEFSLLKYLLPISKKELKNRIKNFTNEMLCPPEEPGRPFAMKKPFKCSVQPLRSLGPWSGGLQDTERSIQNAYCNLIKNSKKFVYIENQFFCTTVANSKNSKNGDASTSTCNPKDSRGQPDIENDIGQVIVDRIVKAHENNEDFKFYFIIPLMPEGEMDVDLYNNNTIKTIMHFQYAGILRDDTANGKKDQTMFTYLQSKGIDPYKYMSWGCLRAYQHYQDGAFHRIETESIYVHSKLMIVDDEHVIIGSANLNDRSQLGDRDSEVCLKFSDPEKKFGSTLRHRLWSTFMGKDIKEISKLDPASEKCWDMWNRIKSENQTKLDRVFGTVPNNNIRSYDELTKYWFGSGSAPFETRECTLYISRLDLNHNQPSPCPKQNAPGST